MGDQIQIVTDYVNSNQKKLLHKRIDCYMGYPVFEAMSKYRDKIECHPMTLINTGGIHIALSKKNNTRADLEALNTSLARIRADGTYDRIVKKYSEKYGISKW